MKDFKTVEPFAPGEYLRDELAARGWTQKDLAAIIKQPPSVVNAIINGNREISLELARALSDAIGNSVHHWIKLQTIYQLSSSPEPNNEISRRAKLYNNYPIREMIRRGWIKGSDNTDEIEAELCSFLNKQSIDERPSIKYAARKSTDPSSATPIQEAWLARVWALSQGTPITNKYQESLLPIMLRELNLMKSESDEIRRIPKTLANYGIRFLIVEALPSTKIDGACLWLDQNSPVVALSLRHKRIDNFWFTLMHELGHVKRRNANVIDLAILDMEKPSADKLPRTEELANEFAAQFLIDQKKLENFINRYSPAFSLLCIEAFAMNNCVHPGIVVGQLQHKGKLLYSHGKRFLVDIRSQITGSAVTDGFDNTIEIQ